MMALVFGGKGWIGSEFVKQLVASRIVTKELPSRGFDGKGYTFKQLDFIIKQAEPDLVINCSGYTGKPNVDACEDHKAEAIMSNVVFVKMLAESCGNLGMPLAHVSSGCIYNGYEKEFTEEDPPNFTFDCPPCSFYSGTKAMAESVLTPLKKKWVWRLRIPFEAIDGPRNYLAKIMRYNTLLDMRNSLSHRTDFVKACVEMVLRYKPFGVYNMTNPGSVTTKEVITMLQETLVPNKDFTYFEDLDAFNKTVRTPRSNCVLNTDKLAKTGIVMRPVKEALQDTINHWKW